MAHGLLAAGLEVNVYERDEANASRLQGYRLSLTPDGLGALKALLPQPRWQDAVAACTAPLPGIAFLSQRSETKFFRKTPDPEGDARRHSSISRVTLREILLRGIEDRVRFGHTCTGYELRDSGRVACLLADRAPETGDALVGADGTRSVIRTQLLPVSNRYETGVSAIAGKVYSDGDAAKALIAPPIGQSAVVIGDEPQDLFIADHQLAAGQTGDSYAFWSFLTSRERFPEDVAHATPQRLVAIVDEMTPEWHPRLKALMTCARPESVTLLDYASSHRPAPWSRGPVSLIGDAIHNMPPTGGEGTNMALKDAAVLRDLLVSSEQPSLPNAMAEYRTRMINYAFHAVDTSMHNLQRMVKRVGGPSRRMSRD